MKKPRTWEVGDEFKRGRRAGTVTFVDAQRKILVVCWKNGVEEEIRWREQREHGEPIKAGDPD